MIAVFTWGKLRFDNNAFKTLDKKLTSRAWKKIMHMFEVDEVMLK